MYDKFEDPRKAFGAEVTRLAAEDERICVVSADSYQGSGFAEFPALHPERFFEVGIAEQAAVGVAAGLATCGKIPVFACIAPFACARPYEMFRNDLGYMKQNAKIVGRNGGMTYSDLGSTHYSLDDYAIMSEIPGVVVINPADGPSIRACVRAMMKHEGPVYMRVGNEPVPQFMEGEFDIEIGKGIKLTEGTDLTVVVTGAPTAAALEAVKKLQAEGKSIELLYLPIVWPIDEELILESAKKTGKVLTVEEAYVHGGLGTMVSEFLSEKHPTSVTRLGVPNCYPPTGPYAELVKFYKLDADGIEATIKEVLK